MKTLLSALCGLVLLGAVATAEPQKGKRKNANADPKARFEAMDRNHDGKVSLEEYLGPKGKNKETKTARFKKLDRDGDGFLTMEEAQGRRKKK